MALDIIELILTLIICLMLYKTTKENNKYKDVFAKLSNGQINQIRIKDKLYDLVEVKDNDSSSTY